jgi:hypothetical protein
VARIDLALPLSLFVSFFSFFENLSFCFIFFKKRKRSQAVCSWFRDTCRHNLNYLLKLSW